MCSNSEYPGDVAFVLFLFHSGCFEPGPLTLVDSFPPCFCLFGFCVSVCGPTLIVGRKFVDRIIFVQKGE